MATTKQQEANRANAQKSTGPKTEEGKHTVSGNRITHGILSNRLLLEGERAEDYQALLDGLISDLKPEGAVELAIVEKIAIVFWRERRLVAAESGTSALSGHNEGNAYLYYEDRWRGDYPGQALRLAVMQPPEDERRDWCRDVIQEYRSLDVVSLQLVEEKCPQIYGQLLSDAGGRHSIAAFLENYGKNGLTEYIRELINWCRRYSQDAERYTEFQSFVANVNAEGQVPWHRLELLSKYQTSLDNQLYKAMKALREAQEWRLERSVLEAKGITTESG